ncbi:translation initiation factor IF-2-like [Onychomys torridus]|uniref:translation initiation factor IF-2-like n=1 Tax=Onychomys torridus TaxID=38674 RepID=UPI00167FA43C|nr:translation initiation factor IF-2-like [Onychomys torridus]
MADVNNSVIVQPFKQRTREHPGHVRFKKHLDRLGLAAGDDEGDRDPASQLRLRSTRRHPETAPPRRSLDALGPVPAASRPRRPGAAAPLRSRRRRHPGRRRRRRCVGLPFREREGRKTNNKTWLLVPSGNRGPAGSDEGEVVRSAGARPALPARLPEQPERSGTAASAPPEPLSARPLARARGRVTAPPRPAPPRPGRGLRDRPGDWGSAVRSTGRLRRADGPAARKVAGRPRRERGRPVGGGSVLDATRSRLHRLGDAAGGGQVWASDLYRCLCTSDTNT